MKLLVSSFFDGVFLPKSFRMRRKESLSLGLVRDQEAGGSNPLAPTI
jgi:hypothetical protein